MKAKAMTNKSRSHPNAIAIHVAERKLAWDSKREKCLDDMLIRTIQGLDVFIAQSSDLRIGIIARILQTAKEELVHWAANQDFNETRAESFINRLL